MNAVRVDTVSGVSVARNRGQVNEVFRISLDLPSETGVVISRERIAEDLRQDKI